MSAPINLFVGIASGRDARWPFPISLANLVGFTIQAKLPTGTQLHLEGGRMFDTAQSRRRLVSRAKELNATHILFIDDDMDFPPDAAVRLINHQKEIIAASYTCRGFPVIPLAMRDGKRIFSRNKTGLERVDWAPTGLMMIDMKVFDKISKPYFEAHAVSPESDEGVSDDVFFCRKAITAGVEIWIDHDLSLKTFHVGDMAFGHGSTASAESRNLLEMCREVLG